MKDPFYFLLQKTFCFILNDKYIFYKDLSVSIIEKGFQKCDLEQLVQADIFHMQMPH